MWVITVLDLKGQLVGRVPFKSGIVTLGRDPRCTIVLNPPPIVGVMPSALGARHARIEPCDDSRLLYNDEGAPGGSLLDGVRIEGSVFLGHGRHVQIPGFRVGVERINNAEARTAPTVLLKPPLPPPLPAGEPEDGITSELDRQIHSIKTHRADRQHAEQSKAMRFEQGWAEIMVSAQRLHAKLAGDPRVLHFNVTRDHREIAVKLAAPGEKSGYRYFLLSREHPDGKYEGLAMVWLREFGSPDASYEEPYKGMSDLVQRIAATLA